MAFPCARRFSEISVEWVGDEAVVLIPETLVYHAFSGGAYEVWRLADGRRSKADLAELVFGDVTMESLERVEVAVEQLGMAGLLEGVDEDASFLVTRRRVARLAVAGVVGAVGLPVVKSITVPDAASAVTRPGGGGPGDTCGFGLGGCLSGCCCGVSEGSTQGVCADFNYCTSNFYHCI